MHPAINCPQYAHQSLERGAGWRALYGLVMDSVLMKLVLPRGVWLSASLQLSGVGVRLGTAGSLLTRIW